MPHKFTRTSFGLSGAAMLAVAAFSGTSAAVAADVSVTVDGQAISLSPPPVERAGRVFVPLRGIFERLGATVVYQGGVINATGNGRTISLRIGSTQATVAGNSQPLDVAPFVVGASTYVPLRFVSQALGATVNFDGANRIVAIATGGNAGNSGPVAQQAPPQQQQAMRHDDVLRDLQPDRNATVGARRPTVSANFAQSVDPNALVITLDGLDVSSASTRSNTGFIYAPPSPLQSGDHRVEVRGKFASGQPFETGWRFSSGTAAAANTLSVASPRDGDGVPSTFTLSGRTAPNARVHIVAGATANLGGVFAFGAGNYTGDTVADASGAFSQEISLQTVRNATIGVTVTSTDPVTKGTAEQKLTLQASR